MNMTLATYRPRVSGRRCEGLTLIEVLVSLIVLSIGILGLASMQTASLRFNTVANQTSQATALAYDMADRMRANLEAARAGDYNIAFQTPAPACAAPNTAGTMAAQDISAWRMALTCRLPEATGSIDAVGDEVRLIVRWDDSRGENAARTFEFRTAL